MTRKQWKQFICGRCAIDAVDACVDSENFELEAEWIFLETGIERLLDKIMELEKKAQGNKAVGSAPME